MRAIFSAKREISRDALIRAEDRAMLMADLADLKHALDYINTYDVKRKQHNDGSYEQDEEGT